MQSILEVKVKDILDLALQWQANSVLHIWVKPKLWKVYA